MRVTVRLGGSLAGSGPGERRLTLLHGATVRAVAEDSGPDLPDMPTGAGSTPTRRPIILLNGRNIEFLAGLDTPLADGDVVAIFPASEGG